MRCLVVSAVCALICLPPAHADVPASVGPGVAELQAVADRVLLRTGDPGFFPTPFRAYCGTVDRMVLRARWQDLPEKTRARLALSIFQQGRPTNQTEYVSPSGHFRIHYDTTGQNAVAADDANRNAVPDYVEEVGATADSAWALEIGRFRFNPPPSDGTTGGGRDQYDLYIRELSRESVYGNTYPENTSATTSTSYIEIDNNYTDRIYATKGRDGLHVTLAHEFFHAVQFGYYSLFDAAWWQETTAVWMEDAAYTEINDYYQYLPDYLSAPDVSLDRFLFGLGDLHPFGSVLFIHNLHALFGITPIRAGWESLASRKAWSLDAINGVLPGGFDHVFPRFALWNYFTGARTRPGYYPEAAAYPLVKVRAISVGAGQVLSDSGRVDHLGAAYLQFKPAGQPGGLSLAVVLSTRGRWKVNVLLIQGATIQIMETDASQVRIPAWGQYDEIVVIPASLSLSDAGFTYRITAEVRTDVLKPARAVGDFNADGEVGFTDFFAFAEAFGRTASAASFDPRYDLNGDGGVGFDDFFIFAAHFGEKGD